MAIDFPASPTLNDEYTFEGRTWRWNGTGWEVKEYPAALLTGTAANPSLYFSGDPNTGIYSPGANELAVATNGTGRLFVGSTGNIGLSEASPTALLHIAGTKTAGGIKIVSSNSTSASPGIEVIGARGGSNNSSNFAGKLLLSKNRTDAAINSTGVLGSVAFGGNHTDGTEANILYSASIAGVADGAFNSAIDMPTALVFNTGATGQTPDTPNVTVGTERLRVTSAGLVGIGTSAPTAPLTVIGEDNATQAIFGGALGTTDRGLRIATALLSANNAIAILDAQSTTAGTLAFQTASTERMRIRNDGNIGIGGFGSNNASIYNQKALSGSTIVYGSYLDATISSGVTNTAHGFRSRLGTEDASFTLSDLIHFRVSQATIPVASTVTAQYGFEVQSNMTGATSNYAFYGALASADGRWNFYASGTAPNYFAGDVRTNTVVTVRTSPTNSNISVTATAASLLDGLRTGTPTGNINLTLPTGTNMDAAFQELQTNQSFEWSLINLATAASGFDVTVTANTTHTVVGRMVVNGETSGRFLTRKTAANTFISYRIA